MKNGAANSFSKTTRQSRATIYFDDFLELSKKNLAAVRLLVITGKSGSGKSTILRFLSDCHPDYEGRSAYYCGGLNRRTLHAALKRDVVFIDELLSLSELPHLWRLLRSSTRVVAAAHLPGWIFKLLQPFGSLVLAADRDCSKIARYLESASIRYTDEAVEHFCREFGATFTDIDIILERSAELRSFDQAYNKFRKFDSLQLE